MDENINFEKFTRKATLNDFFGDDDIQSNNDKNNKNKQHNNHNQQNQQINKNQQEFGHKKRIKP